MRTPRGSLCLASNVDRGSLCYGLDLGLWSKVALSVTLVFFITFFNAMQGVREVNPVVLANARILGAKRSSLLTQVYFPAAASWILSSLRTSVGFAVVGAIIGEYLGASAGLGYLIAQAEGNFDAVGVFAGIMILAMSSTSPRPV